MDASKGHKHPRIGKNDREAETFSDDLVLFNNWQWATIVGGLVVASLSLASAAFLTFETRLDHDKGDNQFEGEVAQLRLDHDKIEKRVDSRLSNIENMLSQLILIKEREQNGKRSRGW